MVLATNHKTICGPTVCTSAHTENARRPIASDTLCHLLPQDPDAWFEQPTEENADTAGIERLVEARQAARSARDFATADRIRAELASLGVTVEDSSSGSVWRRTG